MSCSEQMYSIYIILYPMIVGNPTILDSIAFEVNLYSRSIDTEMVSRHLGDQIIKSKVLQQS